MYPPKVLTDTVSVKIVRTIGCRGVANVETVRRSFFSYYYAYGAAADLMTAGRQLLVCTVCVWDEGLAVSQSGFWVLEERLRSTNDSLFLSFFLVSLYIALMMI